MERILVVGCLGYVGPAVIRDLRASFENIELVGSDTGYFQEHSSVTAELGADLLSNIVRKDVRDFTEEDLTGITSIVYLAALSNDPLGASFPGVTEEINAEAAIRLASMAKLSRVKRFIFASSASVYGSANQDPKAEKDALDPLTEYAVSKVKAEKNLRALAGPFFQVTCLRFATACGWSPSLRLDLVLNDFVASAVTTGRINVLSDGSPWRPLIHVRDMARAVSWSVSPSRDEVEDFVVTNVGRADWNFQIRDLANAVAETLPGTEVSINTDAPSDKRSYCLDFSQWLRIAPEFQPTEDLFGTIQELALEIQGLREINSDFRTSDRIRLLRLKRLIEKGLLTEDLRWSSQPDSFTLEKQAKNSSITFKDL